MDSRRSWLTTALAFTAMFVSVGTGYSYGALVLPVSRDLDIGQGAASGVFAVTIMVFFLVGAPIGMLSDRVGPRLVLVLGGFALPGGLVLTAGAQSGADLYLGHGLLVGLGMASTFIPLTVVVSTSFERHRSLAVGIAVSGIGLGTLVMAPLTAFLIGVQGWRHAYLTLAAVGGLTLLACAAFVRRPPAVHRPSFPPLGRTLRSPDYRALYIAQVLLSVAVFTPFSYLPAYAEESGNDAVTAAGLVGVIGAASVVGRLALGPVADRMGLLRTYRLCYLAIGVSFMLWLWPGGAYPALLVHAIIFGVGYGGFVALLPGVLAERFGLQRLGGLLGLIYTSNVIGAGLGPLMTGLLIERYGYLPAALTALVCGLGAAAVLSRVTANSLRAAEQPQWRPRRR